MRGPQPPDVLLYLVDWFMPEPDGIETIRQLRAMYTASNTTPPPMLLVTAHIFDDDLQQVDHLIDGLVSKPISARRLNGEIAAALGLRSQALLKSGARKTDGLDWSGLRWLDILLVEDVEVNREVMLELLGGVGLKLRIATNGAEAIAAIQGQTPDLVLMDCQMPVMDGYTATSKLRAMPEYAQLPIVALTAGAMIDDKRRCFAAGMNGYVSKPVRLEQLYEQMMQCVPERRRRATPARPSPHAAAQAELPLPAWPGIDVALGLAQVGGRQATYVRVLKKFRDNQCAHFEDQFAAAIQREDWVGAARLAHSLKGVGRTLGASDLAERTQRLELALEQRNLQEMAFTLDKVLSQLHTVTTGLARLDDLVTAA
jgi:CheY-like chemotaxis protein